MYKVKKNMTIGENLKLNRVLRGMSQQELANAVGVTPAMICQIERGSKSLSLALAIDICKRLEIDIKDLIK